MSKRTAILIAAWVAVGSVHTARADEGRFAKVNGLKMYYEIHGRQGGTPLVLLHGGGSTIDSTFGRVLPMLAQHREVIAIEEQAHGRTSDRKGPIRFETSADDVATLLQQLHVEKADLFGFSNGASVAMEVAIRHPALVRKLIYASSITKKDGAAPQFWELIKNADFSVMPRPLKDAFLKETPDPVRLRNMHDKDLERMRSFTDIPDSEVRAIQAPTLVISGDRDVPKPEHAVELTHLLPHARLLIVPSGHGDYIGEITTVRPNSPLPALTVGVIEDFLNSPDTGAS